MLLYLFILHTAMTGCQLLGETKNSPGILTELQTPDSVPLGGKGGNGSFGR